MFTGIITNVTDVLKSSREQDGLRLTFRKPAGWHDLEEGESISTDGVCITVEAITDQGYTCYLMPETLQKSTFGAAVPESVNLERSMRAGDRFGGHFVQGHVDDTGEVTKVTSDNDGLRLSIGFNPKHQQLVVDKGSITINGVSLTVTEVKDNVLSVALIPYTVDNTTLGKLKVGDKVNLEFDMIAKHVSKMVNKHADR